MAKKKKTRKKVVKKAPKKTVAKKKAKAAKKKTKKKYVLPGGCGPLADMIFDKLEQKKGDETLKQSSFKNDYLAGAEFLKRVPGTASFADVDLEKEYRWGTAALKIIREA